MTILYSEYKKKYAKELNEAEKTLLEKQRQEKLNNMSVSEAKKYYSDTKVEKYASRKNLINTYENQGVSVNKTTLYPTADKYTYLENKRYSDPVTPDTMKNWGERKKQVEKSKENYENFKELSTSKEVETAKDEWKNAFNKTAEAYLNYEQRKLDNDKIGWYDKTVGNYVGGLTSYLSLEGENAINENGQFVRMPTYNELKRQKVRESYGDGFWGSVGKAGSDALYEMGKVTTASVLNKIVPGLGAIAYNGKIFSDSFNETVSEGYSGEKSVLYAATTTAINAALGAAIGGTAKMVFGGSSSELSKYIGNAVSKVFKNNSRLVNSISNAISEGTEESLQEYLDVVIRNVTLGENEKVFSKETFENALYSGLVGGLVGAYGGSNDGVDYHKVDTNTAKVITNSNTNASTKVDTNTKTEEKTSKVELPITNTQTKVETNTEVSLPINYQNNTDVKTNLENNINLPLNENVIEKTDNTSVIQNQTSEMLNNKTDKITPWKHNMDSIEKKTKLTNQENEELSLLSNIDNTIGLNELDQKRYDYLVNKSEGKINYPELENKTSYESIKQEYSKYKNLEDFDKTLLEEAKSLVTDYHNTGKRTKADWLDVANYIGENFKGTSQELEKYSIQSWFSAKPNTKDTLNRQGQRYVDFTISDWMNAVYSGANVGKTDGNTNISYSVPTGNYNGTSSDVVARNYTQKEILRDSARKYLNNTTDSKSIMNLLEKIIDDKGYVIKFNPNVTNEQGVSVDGKISKENGQITIELNPNSNNYVEFLIVHEITHDIATSEMKKLILDYAKQNPEFEKSLESLKERYQTDDVSDEVVADVCAELFGNKEFIQSVVEKKPNIFKKILNNIKELARKIKDTGADEYINFVEKLKTMWEDAYYSNIANIKNNNTFYSKMLDNSTNIDYNKLSYEVIPYISADERKIKFLEYGQAESFYELDYETMAKAIAIGSKYAIEAQNKGLSNSYFTDNNYMYYFDVLDTSNNAFGITKVDLIENSVRSDVDERIKMENNGLFNGTAIYEQKFDNSNIKSIENRTTSNYDVELVGGKQEQQGINEGRQNTKENIRNIRELENSSFYVEEKIDEAINNIEQRNSRDNELNEEFKKIKEKTNDKISHSNTNTFKEKVKRGTKNIVNYILESYPELNVKIENSNKSNSFYVKFYSGENIVGKLRVSDHVRPPKRISSGWEQHVYDAQYVPNVNAQDNLGKPVFYNETNAKNELIEIIKDNLEELSEDTKYSLPTKEWVDHLKENYPSAGTKTKMSDIKLPLISKNKKIDSENSTKESSSENTSVEKIAEILDSKPKTKIQKENRLKTWFATKILDKGYYIEKIARDYNNDNLKVKYDYSLNGNGIATQIITNGRYDNKGNKIGKSLQEIFEPIENANLVKEFSEYMYHSLNVDRMSLENTFNEKNKPVFGESVDGTKSTQVVNELEKMYPEFETWAKNVYDYNKANLQMLADYGVINVEDISYYDSKYPHYVPIMRDNSYQGTSMIKTKNSDLFVGSPIKKAKGGTSNILPLKDAMANRTIQTVNSALKNDVGNELLFTLYSTDEVEKLFDNSSSIEEVIETASDMGIVKPKENEENATLTIFNGGRKLEMPISDEIYEALTRRDLYTFKPLNKMNNIRRGLLTEYNPTFILTNPIKDIQDGLVNSKHPKDFIKNLPEAVAQIKNKGKIYQLYVANGGSHETYFNYDKNMSETKKVDIPIKNKALDKIASYPKAVLNKISSLNEAIEMAPRLAEFMASIDNGDTVKSAMYNAQEITTNFKRGGDIAKNLDRNGFTFLNANIQGFYKQIRNFQESKVKGLRGMVALATRMSILGLTPVLLSEIVWDKDEEYEELSDYIKNNYYIVGKYDDGKFIKIPKGRVVSVLQKFFQNIIEGAKGEEIDIEGFVDLLENQILPSNPSENNLASPLIQAFGSENGTAWYGGDIVPSRLQNLPNKEQYDESTDSISVWLGDKLNISPYKINYVLDQYSGAIGDYILPYLTQEAESAIDNSIGKVVAPLSDKFTVDSTMKNQNVTDFYSIKEELEKKSNSSNATSEDKLKSKYLSSISSEMSELYAKKREIQSSDIADSKKYNQAKEIQKEIIDLAKKGLDNYENISVLSNYGKVADNEYYLNTKDKWTKIDDEELNDLNSLNLSSEEKNMYFETKNRTTSTKSSKILESSEKKKNIADIIIYSDLGDQTKGYLYSKYYSSNDTIEEMLDMNIPINEYIKFDSQNFQGEYDKTTGKAINGSRKNEVINYVNSLNLTIPQKAILIKSKYSSYDNYNNQIINYVNALNKSANDKKILLKSIGFDNYDGDIINYINSQHISKKEKEKKLKELGFTIRDGRVYYK